MMPQSETTEQFTLIDLFSGVGGLSFGFEWDPSFKVIALNDIDKNCHQTNSFNFPDTTFICDDVSNLKGTNFTKLNGNQPIDIVIGGPPCQGFSMAGKQLFHDKRNHLFREFIRIISELKPKLFLMENVPEILRIFGEYVSDEFTNYFSQQGYLISPIILNAANYGVPQTRNRAFIMGVRKDIGIVPSFPLPTHNGSKNGLFDYNKKIILKPRNIYGNEIMGKNQQTFYWMKRSNINPDNLHQPTLFNLKKETYKYQPLITVWDAIGDLPSIPNGTTEIQEYENDPSTPYQQWIRNNTTILKNHNRWGHTKRMIARIKNVPEGGNMKDLPKEYQVAGAFSQAYARLHRHGLARTITTFIHNPGSGRYIHPRDDRAISIREAARLQSFPDTFIFLGNLISQERQVGNAVPPLLSFAIAKHIAKLLSGEPDIPHLRGFE